MDPRHQKIHDDIIRLHEEVEMITIKTLDQPMLEILGIHVREVLTTLQGRVSYNPCFFKPTKRSWSRPQSHPRAESGKRSFSISSTSSSGNKNLSEDSSLSDTPQGHPLMLERCAKKNNRALRKTWLPDVGPALCANGAIEKRKFPHRNELELHDNTDDYWDKWEVENVFEDHAHQLPHAIFDIHQTCPALHSSVPSMREIRAILRVLRSRIGMSHNQGHANYPILVLSYLGWRHGRILQAHHDGQHLVIQFSQTLNFKDFRTTPQPL